MMDFGQDRIITDVAVSTLLGHGGGGDWKMKLAVPGYSDVCERVLETGATTITKPGTYPPWQGIWKDFDPRTWWCVQDHKDDSMLNSYGLTNSGALVNAQLILNAFRAGYKVTPNISPQFHLGLETAINQAILTIALYKEVLKDFFWCVEINISCGNTKGKVVDNVESAIKLAAAVRAAFPWLKVIYKVNYDHPYELSQELETKQLADAIHAINSVRYEKVYGSPYTSPLYGKEGVNGGGSVSGGEIFDRFSFPYTKGLRKAIKLRILMGGGISCMDHVKMCLNECIDIRTDSLSVCTWPKRKSKSAIDLLTKSWVGTLRS